VKDGSSIKKLLNKMKTHFIAIGGSVMHQLAIALKNKGYEVTGSDDEIFEPARTNLLSAGILPAKAGWFPNKITPATNAVVLGMHAKNDNPELIKARSLKIPVYSFPEYIYQESQNKTRIVIGGSHGKTTITSMIMHVMQQCGKEFDYLVGARLDGFEHSVQLSDAPVIVCEGDEYPASTLEKRPKFHFLAPHIAVISGIAWDHINVFPTFENYVQQFRIFIDKIENNGTLIYNAADKVLKDIATSITRKNILLQPYDLPEFTIDNGVTIVKFGDTSCSLKVFGRHNLMNASAAREVCHRLGIGNEMFAHAIASFSGASKRLELIAENNHTNIYRDFAHAPSKVKATIQAVKEQFPSRKLVAVLELHTYSSLNTDFLREYEGGMDGVDTAIIFYTEHALQLKQLPSFADEEVQKGFKKKDIYIYHDKESLLQFLYQQHYANTNLLLMSSGNFDGMDMDDIQKLLNRS
jgi:UDP-N-acetylmuramate: L-alanyl-gamma-D-glutamyl-meso-diaminopimelate ligase